MWSKLWGTSTKPEISVKNTVTTTNDPQPVLKVLLVDGEFRHPKTFQVDGTNVFQVRRCIFKALGHSNEREEEYAPITLVAGHYNIVLWYNVVSKNTSYGAVMKFNPRVGCFVDFPSDEQVVLPYQKEKEEEKEEKDTKKRPLEPAAVEVATFKVPEKKTIMLMMNGTKTDETEKSVSAPVAKRPRGRPRKNPLPATVEQK